MRKRGSEDDVDEKREKNDRARHQVEEGVQIVHD